MAGVQYSRSACADCGTPVWKGTKRCMVCRSKYVLSISAHNYKCEQCGTVFRKHLGGRQTRKHYAVRWCSRRCVAEWRKANPAPPYTRLHECRCGALIRIGRLICGKCKALKHAAAQAERLKGVCPRCSVEFARERKYQRFCGEACRAASYQQTRKRGVKQHKRKYGKKWRAIARARGVEYEPINVLKVFERDGWKCGICGKPTLKEKRGSSHRHAPTLDHRVPISKGGPHLYVNVQCSHRECNTRKGNASSIGQLPLWNQ